MKWPLAGAILIVLTVNAVAYFVAGSGGQSGGPFSGLIAGITGTGSPVPPPTCLGAIDLSKGCPLPMLGW